MEIGRIVLAHEADFVIGDLAVYPSTREVARAGSRHVIEPRVMQVLVALHRAGGAVVSKDDLVESCWEGRVVGEDAINRVISRLRKLGEETAAGEFRIETVTRVGYRLVQGADAKMMSAAAAPLGNRKLSRRMVLAGVGAAAAAATGGAYLWLRPPDDDLAALPSDVRDVARQAQESVLYGTPEQTERGISLLKQATTLAPDSAILWGRLSLAYGQQAQQSAQQDYERLIAKARSAGQRALSLDPSNVEGRLARIFGGGTSVERIERDRMLRALVAERPDHPAANRFYAILLSQVGRNREAIPHLERAIVAQPYAPMDGYALAQLYWCANRLDEADREMERTYQQWPRHYGVWFTRYKHFAYTGRIAEARAMLLDIGRRPTGIPEENFRINDLELTAFATRAPADIAKATELHDRIGRTAAGFAQNAMQFAAATGNRDMVFALADGLYFNRGFTVGQQRYTSQQGLFSPARRRPTFFLFNPPFASCWRDSRFDALVEELGLTNYWRQTGSTPDYRRV